MNKTDHKSRLQCLDSCHVLELKSKHYHYAMLPQKITLLVFLLLSCWKFYLMLKIIYIETISSNIHNTASEIKLISSKNYFMNRTAIYFCYPCSFPGQWVCERRFRVGEGEKVPLNQWLNGAKSTWSKIILQLMKICGFCLVVGWRLEII